MNIELVKPLVHAQQEVNRAVLLVSVHHNRQHHQQLYDADIRPAIEPCRMRCALSRPAVFLGRV